VTKEQVSDFDKQDEDFRFAVAVAGFAQLMKNSKFTQDLDYQWVIDTANNARGDDEFGYRSEFVKLARSADSLKSTAIISSNNVDTFKKVYPVTPLVNQ
jgi:Ca-activated chloride channel family protein